MDKAKSCAFRTNYHFIGAVKYRRSVLLGSVEVRFVEVLKMIAGRCGFELLAVRVHDGCHVHVFVSALPKVCISDMVRLFKCNSAKLLFLEFASLRLRFWCGHLWSEGYAVRTVGIVASEKSKNTSTDLKNGSARDWLWGMLK
jgi:putative transposase